MLTEITATQGRGREITHSQLHHSPVEVELLFYRRLKDTAVHEAKRTTNGMPVRTALFERAWIEQFAQQGSMGWQTSFNHCCMMLREDANEERAKCLQEISRAWRKALIDWAMKHWQKELEEIMKADDCRVLPSSFVLRGTVAR